MLPIDNFVNKIANNWGYAIPSDNLWVIEIKTHNRGIQNESKSSFEQLYKNILAVNTKYKSMLSNTLWKVTPGASINKFISGLTGDIKLFLANEINYSTNSNMVFQAANSQFSQFGGFLSQGKVLQSRSNNLEAKITFISTNWNINEILIDPWIAAIAQQGLIEDSTLPNIKSDITIYEYAKGYPGKSTNSTSLALRKEVTLYEAFPISRDESKLDYETDNAGKVKTQTTSFAYRDYNITYHLDF